MENMQSEQVNELFAALAKAQGEMKAAQKDSANPFFKSKYADLSSVMEACRETLSKNGLSVTQTPIILNGPLTASGEPRNVLITTLGHSSGQWIKSVCPLLMAKNDAQSFGAAVTYMRRFALAAMVGVCPEDDDGERERKELEKQEKEKEKTKPKPTDKQIVDLENVLNECSEEFQKKVGETLTRKGWSNFSQMDLESFIKLMSNSLKERSAYQDSLTQEMKEDEYEVSESNS